MQRILEVGNAARRFSGFDGENEMMNECVLDGGIKPRFLFILYSIQMSVSSGRAELSWRIREGRFLTTGDVNTLGNIKFFCLNSPWEA